MVVQTNGEIKISNSCDEEIPLVKDCSNVEIEEPMHRDPLVIKSVLKYHLMMNKITANT